MTNFSIDHEAASGILVCRVTGFLSDAEGAQLARAFLDEIGRARRGAPILRILFDNREGNVFSSASLGALVTTLKGEQRPGDRAAVLVANSINKSQARRNMSDGNQVFLSEQAARTWLTIEA